MNAQLADVLDDLRALSMELDQIKRETAQRYLQAKILGYSKAQVDALLNDGSAIGPSEAGELCGEVPYVEGSYLEVYSSGKIECRILSRRGFDWFAHFYRRRRSFY